MKLRSKLRCLQLLLYVLACVYGVWKIPILEAGFGVAIPQNANRCRPAWTKVMVVSRSERHPNINKLRLSHPQSPERVKHQPTTCQSRLCATKQNEPPQKKDETDDKEKRGLFGSVLNMLPFGSKEPPPPPEPQPQESGFKLPKLPLDLFKKDEQPEVTLSPEERRKMELRERAQAERERRQQEIISQQREQERRQEEMRIQAAKREAERRKNQAEELLQRERTRKRELEERRRKIQQASKTKPAKAITATNEETNKGDKPFWVFWNQTKEGDDQAKPTLEGNSKNPLSAAQKFVYGVWDATVGTLTAPKEEWIVLCPKTAIAPGEIVPVVSAGLDLLVIASKDGRKVHCIANSCPHLGTPLETGTLERRPVETLKPTIPLSTTTKTTLSQPISALPSSDSNPLQESDVAAMLAEDGCEDCIVCPLHHTAFALESGQVRGEWCPYPPILGSIMGAVKPRTAVAVFDIRTKGKNIEVRINSLLQSSTSSDDKQR